MTDTYIRSSLAVNAVRIFPQTVREALVSDRSFRNEYGLSADASIGFPSGISFRRSKLFEAIRRAFEQAGSSVSVEAASGVHWTVEVRREGASPVVALKQGEQCLLVTHFTLLSPDAEVRLEAFHAEVDRTNLPPSAAAKWE